MGQKKRKLIYRQVICFITYHQMEMVNIGVYEGSVNDLPKLGTELTWLRAEELAARLQCGHVVHSERSERKSVGSSSGNGGS